MDVYDSLLEAVKTEYVPVRTLRSGPRGSVSVIRHLESGQRRVFRRYAGSAEVYRKLLGVDCAHLPRVYEACEKNGSAAVLEEYIQGDTLSFLLGGGPLSPAEARDITGQLCEALWALHSIGAVHRDVKPENVIMRGNEAVLIDFDAARIFKSESSNDTRVLGTTGYAAPEQYGISQSDSRADIYSLGVLLNVMLTGTHPSRRLAGGRLGRVVLRCTMSSPDKRYQDVLSLQKALESGPFEKAVAANREYGGSGLMSKRCKKCGSELPDGAAFCPHCETSQIELRAVEAPKRAPRPWAWALAGAAAAFLLAAIVFPLATRGEGPAGVSAPPLGESAAPATAGDGQGAAPAGEGGVIPSPLPAETEYGPWRVYLTFDYSSGEAQGVRTDSVPASFNLGLPSQLCAESAEGGVDEFTALVESVGVESVPRDGGTPIEHTVPAYDVSFPGACYTSHINYGVDTGVNDLIWTLTMKDGAVIELGQRFEVSEMELVKYSYEDTPLDTAEDLKALLNSIDAGAAYGKAVEIYLPPVVYGGEISLPSTHGVTLYGSSDGENRTRFTGTVTVNSSRTQLTDIIGVEFTGSGGTGLVAHDGVSIADCYFSGWDTAAMALDGSWVGVSNSCFENNGTALYFNTNITYSYSSPSYANNAFISNGTALVIDALPGEEVLSFPGCRFENNGEDIVNNAGRPMVYPG